MKEVLRGHPEGPTVCIPAPVLGGVSPQTRVPAPGGCPRGWYTHVCTRQRLQEPLPCGDTRVLPEAGVGGGRAGVTTLSWGSWAPGSP